ncbi:hypothetical protein D3C81_1363230 [compost metagenome]
MVQLVTVTRAAIGAGAHLHGLELALRVELVVALVRPAASRRAAFGGGEHHALEEGADLRSPRVAVAVVGVFARQRVQPGLREEGVDLDGRGRATGDDRVLFRRRARFRHREAARIGIGVGLEGLRPELLEQQQLLGERLRAEQRARLAVGGNLERGLRLGWQDIFRQRGLAVASYAAGLFEGPGVGRRYAIQLVCLGVLRLIGVGRWIAWRRRSVVVPGDRRNGCRHAQQE